MKRLFWSETAAVAVMLGILLVLSRYGILVKNPNDVAFAVAALATAAFAFAVLAAAAFATVVLAVALAVAALAVAVLAAAAFATVVLAVALAVAALAVVAIAALAASEAEHGVSKPRAFASLIMEAIAVGVAAWCVLQNHVFLATLGSAIGIALLRVVCFASFRRLVFWKPAESK